jgi:hypothetical protein
VTRRLSPFFLVVGCFLHVACGGDTHAADEAVTVADVQAGCDATCSLRRRCDTDTRPAEVCMADCLQDEAWSPGHLRADIVHGLISCWASLTCEEHASICYQRAVEGVGVSKEDVENAPDVKTCLAKKAECDGTSDPFSDDPCSQLIFLVASSRARVAACYEKPCAEIRSCTAVIYGD